MTTTAGSPRTSLPTLELCELADAGVPGVESFSPFCLKVHRALKLCWMAL